MCLESKLWTENRKLVRSSSGIYAPNASDVQNNAIIQLMLIAGYRWIVAHLSRLLVVARESESVVRVAFSRRRFI